MSEYLTILDVGPVTEHTLPIEPGVTIVTGGNEAGKSTCIACVAALAGREVALSVRDGAKKGIIKGLGTTLAIGGKRLSRSGELDADAVEEKIDLGGLIDPRLKSTEAATRHRIKALLSLTGQTLTITDFASILPEGRAAGEILAADFDDDPVEMAGKIKRRMDKKAKEFEDKAKDLEARMTAKSGQYVGVDLNDEHDPEKLQAAYLAAVQENEKLKAAATSHATDKENRDKARESIAASAESVKEVQSLEDGVLVAARELSDAGDRHRLCSEKIVELQRQLQAEEQALESINQQIESKQEVLLAKQEAFEQASAKMEAINKARELLAQPATMPPSPDDIAAAAEAVSSASAAIDNGFKVRLAIENKAEYKKLVEEYAKANDEAQIYRDAAAGTMTVLSNAVACETLKVIDGDLFYVEGKRSESFARLSAGRRAQVAICEVAKAVATGKRRLAVLPLDQIVWDGLDHASRDHVHSAAIEYGVAIVTGQIRDEGGPLSSFLYKPNGSK